MGSEIWRQLARELPPVQKSASAQKENNEYLAKADEIRKREVYLVKVAQDFLEPILDNINNIIFEGKAETRYEFPTKDPSLFLPRGYDRFISGQQKYLTTDITLSFYKEQLVQPPVYPFFAITLFEKGGEGLSKALVSFSSDTHKEFYFNSGEVQEKKIAEIEEYLALNIRQALVSSVPAN